MITPLENTGALVAFEQDAMLRGGRVSTDDILAGVARRRVRARRRQAACVAFASALVAIVIAIAHVGRTTSESRAVAAGAALRAAKASAGLVLAPAIDDAQKLRFRDGTTLDMRQHAQADVRDLRPHGAVIELARGAVELDVVHTDESRWDVHAGPFGVRVTGTRFVADYDPAAQTLTVAMAHGSVKVTGPCVDETLRAPDTKVFRCVAAAGPPAADVLDTASADTLVGLADAARLRGDAPKAKRTYEKIRRRFPGTPQAAKSAFVLGRMAEGSSPDEAASWFEKAMHEPAYAQEAHGRLLELERRRGNAARAEALARSYLTAHPNGPHAAFAASVVGASP